MRRIRVGWQLSGRAWALLRGHRALLRFPLLGAAAILALAGPAAVAGVVLVDLHEYVAGIPLLVLGSFLAAFFAAYFGVALAAATDMVLRGGDPATADGLAAARRHRGAIAGWALIGTIAGLALQLLELAGRVGEIARALIGAAWSIVSFLAVPAIALEGLGPVAAIRRSVELFRSRWVEQVTGVPLIGAAVFLFGILPAVGLIAGGVVLWIADGNGAELAAGAVLVAAGALLLAVSTLLQTALRGVFGVVLYRYASDGEALGGFSEDELRVAVGARA